MMLKHQAEVLRKTQQQLIQSEKMASLGNLVAGVAHEVNTPVGISLTAASQIDYLIGNLLLNMESGKITKTRLKSSLDEIRSNTELVLSSMQRAANLIQDFKQVAVDQHIDESRPLLLSEYFQKILSSYSQQLKKGQVTAEVKITGKEHVIVTDPETMAQIFSNLVSNALTHAFPRSSGTFKLICDIDTQGDWINIKLSDNGVGMSEDQMKRIFEPFYTTNRHGGGSGLGLHIVYNLVTHKLNGEIKCSSQVGKGTLFTIGFPATKQDSISRMV